MWNNCHAFRYLRVRGDVSISKIAPDPALWSWTAQIHWRAALSGNCICLASRMAISITRWVVGTLRAGAHFISRDAWLLAGTSPGHLRLLRPPGVLFQEPHLLKRGYHSGTVGDSFPGKPMGFWRQSWPYGDSQCREISFLHFSYI